MERILKRQSITKTREQLRQARESVKDYVPREGIHVPKDYKNETSPKLLAIMREHIAKKERELALEQQQG